MEKCSIHGNRSITSHISRIFCVSLIQNDLPIFFIDNYVADSYSNQERS